MSEVYEAHPTHCPSGHPWDRGGTYLAGWSSNPIHGGMGHRTWTCQACWYVIHAEKLDLRPVQPLA